MSIAEIIEFTASDERQADPNTLSYLSKLYSEDGIKSIYIGIQAEDDTRAILLIDREKYDLDQPLDAFNTASGKSIEEYFPTAKTNPLKFTHVQFPGSYSEPLSSPVVEVVYFTLKPGNSWEQLGPLIKQLADNITHAKGCHAPLLGPAIGTDGLYVGFIGWDSIEDHIDAVKDGILADIISNIRGLADIYLKHWELTLLAK